ncbi:Hpt domain-containing protein [Silvimonas soli]|uniref:Hpt domain-containing protein n=1 Tax=Silvimonas soli TaxID=2980100 RepID=UPI0024B36CB6|nr:Hpt domain-containing protein [Silvimonas soli]
MTATWFRSRNADRRRVILQAFVKNQAATAQVIREALTCNDLQTAQRLAHTLKGLAAMIGARETQNLAAELEASLELNRGADLPRDHVVAQLDSALARQMQAIVAGLRPVANDCGTDQDGSGDAG